MAAPDSHPDTLANIGILTLLEKSKFGTDELIDSFPWVLALISQNGEIWRSNHEAARLLNTPPEKAIGRSLTDVFSPDQKIIFLEKIKNIFEAKETVCEFELSLQSAEGERNYWWRAQPYMIGKHTTVPLLCVVAQDITTLKKAHAQVYALERDLEVTHTLQSLLLPPFKQLSNENIELVSFYQSMDQSGGDWWSYEHLANTNPVVLLGDVTGHGVGSAMVTASVSGAFFSAYQLLAGTPDALPKTLHSIHRFLLRMKDYWMTFSAIELDFQNNEINWTSAGSTPLFIGRAGEVEIIRASSSPLGSDDFEITDQRHPFLPGDRFFCMTDGMFEFTTPGGGMLGISGLRKIFKQSLALSVDEAGKFIHQEILRHLEPPFQDDACFVLVERKN